MTDRVEALRPRVRHVGGKPSRPNLRKSDENGTLAGHNRIEQTWHEHLRENVNSSFSPVEMALEFERSV